MPKSNLDFSMNPYIEILRPLNCIMSAIAVLIGGVLVLRNIDLSIILGMVAVVLITGSGNVINDYVDIEADKINRPRRPIPSGKIKHKTALAYCVALFVVGIALATYVNVIALLIAVVNTFVLIVYSTSLQHKVFVGNAVVAYLVASTFLFGGAVGLGQKIDLGLLTLPLILMALSGLSNFSREIVKDLEDFEGDRTSFLKRIKNRVKGALERFGIGKDGIHSKLSEKAYILTAISSLTLAIVISPLPYLLNTLSLSYLIVLVPTDIAFAWSIYTLLNKKSKNRYSKTQKRIKIAMFLGLLAFIVGILVKI